MKLRKNVGDVVEDGEEKNLSFEVEKERGGMKKYIIVRGRMEEMVESQVMYDIVEIGEEIEIEGVMKFEVSQGGEVFKVMKYEMMEDEIK